MSQTTQSKDKNLDLVYENLNISVTGWNIVARHVMLNHKIEVCYTYGPMSCMEMFPHTGLEQLMAISQTLIAFTYLDMVFVINIFTMYYIHEM